MSLLYDLSGAQPKKNSKFHGGGEYARTVFIELLKTIDDKKIECMYDPNKKLTNELLKMCESNNVKMHSVKNKHELQDLINIGDYKVFYSPLTQFWYTKVNFNNTKFIFTRHGLRTIEMVSDKFEYKYLSTIKSYIKFFIKNFLKRKYIKTIKNKHKKFMQKENKVVIAVSNHTKYSILDEFPFLSENDIKVFYSPKKVVDDFSNKNNKLNNVNIKPQNYFLLVSANRWLKNSYRAVKAFDDLYSKYPNISQKIVLTGLEKNIFNLKNEDKFIFLDYVDREVLEYLYENAYAFLYPSLNEGFGYPPLEAMKYGTPCLVGSTSSVFEICGDSVLYFNPFSVKEIKTRILTILFNSEVYENMKFKSQKRYSEISQRQDKDLSKLVKEIYNYL